MYTSIKICKQCFTDQSFFPETIMLKNEFDTSTQKYYKRKSFYRGQRNQEHNLSDSGIF